MEIKLNIKKRNVFILGVFVLLSWIILVSADLSIFGHFYNDVKIPISAIDFANANIRPSVIDFTDIKNQPCNNICQDEDSSTKCSNNLVVLTGDDGNPVCRSVNQFNLVYVLDGGSDKSLTCDDKCGPYRYCVGAYYLDQEGGGSTDPLTGPLGCGNAFNSLIEDDNDHILCLCSGAPYHVDQ